MRIEPVDERNSSWEDDTPRFRVYLFQGGDEPGHSWAASTYDVTGATVLDTIRWAEEQAGTEQLYAVALVVDLDGGSASRQRGLVWILGVDANLSRPTDAQRNELAGMYARRAKPLSRGKSF
ncbi:hypothetical protein D5S17_09345 [Pseudonocardiaceae bacterium YIM PH 21723]|nr:hypothetical protein D5S17_09345 [Pseudonocardiaceae bacterium YIM PH 21723]